MKTEKQLRRAGEEASEYDIGIADVVEFAGLALGLGPTTTPAKENEEPIGGPTMM